MPLQIPATPVNYGINFPHPFTPAATGQPTEAPPLKKHGRKTSISISQKELNELRLFTIINFGNLN
jgi:hypothetical protein